MSNMMAIMALMLMFYFNEFRYRFWIVLLILLCLGAVVLTGVRSSLGTFLVIVVIYAAWKRPLVLFLSLIPLFFVYQVFQEYIPLLGQLASNRAVGFDNPILRLAGLFALLNSTDSDQLLTIGRSIDLISQFDLSLPFGNGTNLSYEGYDSPSDAYLILLIIDYGWVVFVLLLLPYFLIIHTIRKIAGWDHAIKALLVLLALLILSLVDEGLWYPTGNFIFVIFSGLVAANFSHNREEKMAKPELATEL